MGWFIKLLLFLQPFFLLIGGWVIPDESPPNHQWVHFIEAPLLHPYIYKFSLTREIIPLNMINGDESFGWVKLIGIVVVSVWYRCGTGVVRATTLFWFHGTLPLLYLKTSSFIFSSSIYGVHPFLLLGWTTLKNQK